MFKKISKLLSYSNISFFFDIYASRKIKNNIVKTEDHNYSLSNYKSNNIFADNLILNSTTLINSIDTYKNTDEVLNTLEKLEPDQFNLERMQIYKDGIDKFGNKWFYLDLPLILNHIVKIAKPRNYLEVGVRKGRSLAIVVNQNPKINITAVDLWIANYAGSENPGEEFVRNELKKFNYTGEIEFFNENSRLVLKKFIKNKKYFDLITIDGDHSPIGAQIDLRNAKKILRKGGLIIFDDICNPYHPFLKKIYEKEIHNNIQYNSFIFDAGGYGIAIAIKKY